MSSESKDKMRRLCIDVVKREEEGEAAKILAPSSPSFDAITKRKHKDLPSIEEALVFHSAALKGLETPGLNPTETLRFRSNINGVKGYKELRRFCGLPQARSKG